MEKKRYRLRIDESTCITQTLSILSKYQDAFYTDLCLIGQPNTRKHIHRNLEENNYCISFEGQKEHILKGYRPLESDKNGFFKIISITDEGRYMLSLMNDEFETNAIKACASPGSKLNKALVTRCAITASLMGAGMDPAETISEVRHRSLPRFYQALTIKRDAIAQEKDEKYKFSQMRGVYETRFGKPVPMFPSRGSEPIVFKGYAESKMASHIADLFPTYTGDIDSCIIVSDKWGCALRTVKKALSKRGKVHKGTPEEMKEVVLAPRLSELYTNIHFAPMTEEGINSLRLLEADPTGAAIIRTLLPDPDMYGTTTSIFEYDAKKGDEYYIQFLTGNIGKLIKIMPLMRQDRNVKIAIYCLPEQQPFLKELFSGELNQPRIEVITKLEPLMQDLNSEYGLGLKYFRSLRQ